MTRPAGATRGLVSIFGSTFVELIGYFMLLPMLLFQLKTAGVSTSVAGLFAATGYLGMFLVTPFASAVTQRLGRRATLWLAAALPALAAVGFALTDALAVWFVLKLVSGAAAGLRWVLAEALIAEFSPPGQRGRYVGIFETLVGFTFVIGPAVLAWLGTDNPHALWWVIGFLLTGLAWSLLIPPLPRADDAHSARVGLYTALLGESMAVPESRRRWLKRGALLHDVGKAQSSLGRTGRVLATLFGGVTSSFRTYLQHEELGARAVAGIGGDPRTVALIRGSVDDDVMHALRDADDV